MGVRFRVLGAVEAHADGMPADLAHPKQRGVLAVLLVCANEVVSADELLDRVWGENTPLRGRDTLYSYLSRLRRVLPGVIGRRSGGYVLEADPESVDLHRFRSLTTQARARADDELFRQALELWRGEPFTGLDTPWLTSVRHTICAERLAAELDHTDLLLGRGRHCELLPGLAEMARAHPLDERVAGQLMVALYRSGRTNEALEAYQHVRAQLVDELGAEPGEPLRSLQQQVLTADPALAAPKRPVPRQLPAAPRSFTGRVDELEALSKATGATVVISAIGGAGGVGKTWLALHWAHQNAHLFPDGQLHVNLRGFDATGPTPPAEALQGFLVALGVLPGQVPAGLDERAALFRSTAADRRMLLLLDNAADSAQVTPLLPGTGPCTVLVTSRTQLTGLVTTYDAQPIGLDVLSDDEARELLRVSLGAERLAAEPRAVGELVRCCGGLPLALSIIAARARTRPGLRLATLAAELRVAALDALDAEVSLRSVLSWSYRALSGDAALAFTLLSVAEPDISDAAAEALGVRKSLRELENAHLVTQHVPSRYRMHDLVRLFAREHLRDADDVRPLLDFYLHTAENAALRIYRDRDPLGLAPGGLEFATYDAAFAWFDAERAPVLAAARFAADRGWHRLAWQLPWTIVTYLDRTGRWDDLLRLMEEALESARLESDVDGQARILRMLGSVLVRTGQLDDARTRLEEAFDCYAGNELGQAHTLVSLSWASEQGRDYADALGHAKRALKLYRVTGHAFGTATALNIIGWCHTQRDDHGQALEFCLQALQVYQELGERVGEANALDSVAFAHHRLGAHADAIACFRRALALYREFDDPLYQATTLSRLGDALHDAGEDGTAAYREALALFEDLDHPQVAEMQAKLRC